MAVSSMHQQSFALIKTSKDVKVTDVQVLTLVEMSLGAKDLRLLNLIQTSVVLFTATDLIPNEEGCEQHLKQPMNSTKESIHNQLTMSVILMCISLEPMH